MRHVLPQVLGDMQAAHGWSTTPRVVVHDKASYMVNSAGQQVNPVFSGALSEAGMRSWVGAPGASAAWLCARFGDVYPHETAIAHIRRLLSTRFVCKNVCETIPQFMKRMQAVQDFMNSKDFAADGGGGLVKLAKALRERCSKVVRLKGERLDK